MKILVCGGRDFKPGKFVLETLTEYHKRTPISMIIQGGAWGADMYAWIWAKDNFVPCLNVPANWNKYGKAAGYIRNKQMLTYGPDLVIAFPGGKGTANMVQLAKESGITCYLPAPQSDAVVSQEDAAEHELKPARSL